MASNDDDLLDDLLDSALDDLDNIDKKRAEQEKNAPKPTPTPVPTTTTTTSTPTTSAPPTTNKGQDELADQFAKQMADLFSKLPDGGENLEKSLEDIVKNFSGLELPKDEAGSSSSTSEVSEEQQQKDLTTMLSALAELESEGESNNNNDNSAPTGGIAEKLKKIAENAKNIGDNEAGGEDLEKILQDFESNPEFQSVMESMVNQMISKDVLYEPMKELREKYPKWLEDNRATLSDEDYRKYIEQYNIVQKICIVYETNQEQTQEVVQLMQEMSEYGQPPTDIIKDLAPGVQIGADGVPVFPGAEGGDQANGCSIM